MNRRDFLAGSTTVLCLGIFQTLESCSANSVTPKPIGNLTIDLTSNMYSPLNSIGGYVIVQGIYIIRSGQSTYIAISSVCTHQGCTVNYSSFNKQFICPCHGGSFDMNGNVLSPPPSLPLARYTVTQSGNILTIT